MKNQGWMMLTGIGNDLEANSLFFAKLLSLPLALLAESARSKMTKEKIHFFSGAILIHKAENRKWV